MLTQLGAGEGYAPFCLPSFMGYISSIPELLQQISLIQR
jgi:hypothetical protein